MREGNEPRRRKEPGASTIALREPRWRYQETCCAGDLADVAERRLSAPSLRVRRIIRNFWGQFSDNEFLQQIADGGAANSDSCIFEGLRCTVAIAYRIVKI